MQKTGKNFSGKLFRIFLAVLTVVVLCSLLSLFVSAGDVLCGDYDGNGKVDSLDAIYLLRAATLGTGDYPLNQGGDINGDSKFNSEDAIHLLRAVLIGEEYYPLANTDVLEIEAFFDAYAAKFVCPTHNHVHCLIAYGSDCENPDSFAGLVMLGLDALGEDYTGYTFSANAQQCADFRNGANGQDNFGGQGCGDSAGGNIDITITRDEDGASVTRTIRFYACKAYEYMEEGKGFDLYICPEDSAAIRREINGILQNTMEEALDDNGCLPANVTEEDILAILNLGDDYAADIIIEDCSATVTVYSTFYPMYTFDSNTATYVTEEYDLADVSDIAALYDAFEAAFVCPTHNDFHCKISYGSKCIPETVVALFELGLDTIGVDHTGYTVSVNADDMANLKNAFGGEGAGSGASREITFTITREEDGASLDRVIEVSACKAYPWLDIVGEDYALGICPEDSQAIRQAINGIIGRTLENALDENDCLPVATEEDVLAILDLDDTYGVIVEFGDGIVTITIYDAMYIPFIEDDADEGHLPNETYVTVEYNLPIA